MHFLLIVLSFDY